jgi:serine/threonine-protein kinase
MTPEEYAKVGDLFDEALKHPPGERAGFLGRACAGAPWLRAEVEKWLAHHQQAERAGFLDLPVTRGEAGGAADPGSASPPTAVPAPATVPAGPAPPRGLPVSYADFIRDLLRRRLKVLAVIAAALFGLFLVKDLWTGSYQLVQPRADFLVHATVTLGLLVLAAVLWAPWSLGMTALRTVEVVGVGLGVLFFVRLQVEIMGDAPSWAARTDEDVLLFAGDRIALRWFAGLVLYGVYVPNRPRRCLAVVATLAVTPLAVLVAVAARDGTLRPFAQPLLELAVWVVLASVLAVLGSYKIAIARRVMFEGRKLGQYRVKHLLGKGGMGEVYLAEHVLLGRACALKTIRPERADDAGTLRRFEREVKATAKLSHANVVAIYDYGYAEDGTFYYAMEYVPGLDLQGLVRRHGPLPPGRAIHFLKQAAAALHSAHATGLIHRDVKPSNMIACSRPGSCDCVKLVDFGLVRDARRAAAGESVTQDDLLLGTPSFMSPEQISRPRTIDRRSDVYGLGAVAYFLLTGAPPFARETGVEVLTAHLRDPVIPPSRCRPGIPPDLERVVLRCLEKDPAARFPSAEAVVESLSACQASTAWTGQQAADWWRAREGAHNSNGSAV